LNLLLDACIKLGEVERAVEYVELILQKKQPSVAWPDEVTFNTLLKGCAIQKLFSKSFDLFDLMIDQKITPNQVTYNSLIEVCVCCGRVDDAWGILT